MAEETDCEKQKLVQLIRRIAREEAYSAIDEHVCQYSHKEKDTKEAKESMPQVRKQHDNQVTAISINRNDVGVLQISPFRFMLCGNSQTPRNQKAITLRQKQAHKHFSRIQRKRGSAK
ncbi:MAG: hypothetical protein QXL10_05710 [Candidatus Bathyarchaeia archaeon]